VNQRLQAIATLVGDARRVVDVGCEHGQLALLLQSDWVLGIDCRLHLLQAAPVRQPRLAADGLSALAAAEVVVCAGMGERNMAALLDQTALGCCRRLVLNPSPQPHTLRAELQARGWYCAAEDLVRSGDRYHVIIAAERGQEACQDEDARLVGPRLVEQRHPLLWPFLEDALRRRHQARGDSPEARFAAAASRLLDLA
jgi:tRNA (adenine22-N1)-methyltransferase